MNPLSVVEHKVLIESFTCFSYRRVLMKINLLIFNRSPKALHKDVVISPTFAIHTDADDFFFKDSRKIIAGKLRALIRVENLWAGNLQGILQCPCAEGGVHCG